MRLNKLRPLIEGCFYRPMFDCQEEKPTAKFYTEGLKFILGIEPSINLPRRENLLAQYCPKVKNLIKKWSKNLDYNIEGDVGLVRQG